jgi:hypothetical protein
VGGVMTKTTNLKTKKRQEKMAVLKNQLTQKVRENILAINAIAVYVVA